MTTATEPVAFDLPARRKLCAAQGVTLNGKPAAITCPRGHRALVVTLRHGKPAGRAEEYTWTAAAAIVAAGGRFTS